MPISGKQQDNRDKFQAAPLLRASPIYAARPMHRMVTPHCAAIMHGPKWDPGPGCFRAATTTEGLICFDEILAKA